ncbi:hypothetical protein O6P43_017327 [Quillaja saponaria]|uniref:Uncharacterized protein n=1 Tax=Quillaja saponaria TaxID=32244 RepID=A0AAD7LS60_QUISA|nr:hypothetical protein O6P43_017327 [Quillaja saponaria]
MAMIQSSSSLCFIQGRPTSFHAFEGIKIIWKEGTETGNIMYLDIIDGIGDQCAEKGDEILHRHEEEH